MNIERVLSASGGDSHNTETIAFRLTPADKQQLLDLCQTQNLSLGRLMRALVSEFIEEAKDAR